MKNRNYLIGAIGIIIAIALGGFSIISNDNGAEEHYQEYCASCHGEKLASFVDRQWVYGNSWNEVFKSIKYGIPNDGMPAYDTAFTDKEITALTNYILTGIEEITFDDFEAKPDFSGIIKSKDLDFRLDTVVTGQDIPWGLAFLPNGDLLITERSGKLYRFTKNQGLLEIEGVPKVRDRGQGGLLDVEIHPDFDYTRWIYLSYSKPRGSEATTAIMRAELRGNKLEKQKDIFVAEPFLPTRHHFGSRMEFDKDGLLFFTVGDRGRRDQNPQNLDNHCGKVHRINDDGSIPKDNPFVKTRGAMPSIFSYGHRNPQGLAINRETGIIWENEHGPRGGDEINVIQEGKNYGWPVISYGINYNGTKFTDITEKRGMEQPVHYWVPSIGVCGMAVVTGEKYPQWRGDLLSGSLRFDYIHRSKVEGNKVVDQEILLKNIGRLRDVKMGRDGYIYFSTENPGLVMRILPVVE